VLLVCVAVTCVFVKEEPLPQAKATGSPLPDELGAEEEEGGGDAVAPGLKEPERGWLAEIAHCVGNQPRWFIRINVVNFFSWFGMFSFFMYGTEWMVGRPGQHTHTHTLSLSPPLSAASFALKVDRLFPLGTRASLR
jgi:hypothetical protein